MKYSKSTALTEKGETTREDDETVDHDYVERFTARETLDFFRNLGGTEKVTRSGGIITVRSTNPDGTSSRITVFTPERKLPDTPSRIGHRGMR